MQRMRLVSIGLAVVALTLAMSGAAWAVTSEAGAFLAANGYNGNEYTVLLTWREASRQGPRQMITGYRVQPANGEEAFDLYADEEGTLLNAEAVARLGIPQKNWDLKPTSAEAETHVSLVKAALPRPTPKGIALNVPPQEELELPPIDLVAVQREDWVNEEVLHKGAKRTGVAQEFEEPVRVENGEANYGTWQALPDGAWLWSLYIFSPDAKGQRVHFSELSLPTGASVNVYNADDPGEAYGPYEAPHEGESDLWSATCFGETIVVECYVPASVDRNGVRLTIDKTIHVYLDASSDEFAKSAAGSCNLDVTCYSAWSTTALGVARILFVEGSSSYVCSGSLVADTDTGTDIPYFLTANHCISDQTTASTVEFFWLYQTASCNGTPPSVYSVPTNDDGADFLASLPTPPSSGSDFALLRMRSAPPTGMTYLGWTTSVPSTGTAVTCIHHPSGDYKRISFGSATGGDTYLIEVTWSDGTTEGGSSGSPLMLTSTQKIIGQLYGGYASCSTPNDPDYYGRFSKTYPVVQAYLDPASLYPTATLSAATYSVDEADGTVQITVQLDKAPGTGKTASLDYATEAVSATAGSDYTTTSGTLSFGATETTKSFTVPILSDSEVESTETFRVRLSEPSGCLLSSTNNPATVQIVDDDLSSEPVADFSEATYSVVESWGLKTITVTLNKAPGTGNTAYVDYAATSGTATAGSDFTAASGTLIFGPTQTTQTFNVSITNDAIEELTETIVLTLSNPVGCALGTTNNPASIQITDDDYEAREIDFLQSTYTVGESDGTALITVALNQAPGTGHAVTVTYSTVNDTATPGSDYTSTSGTLTFGAAETQKTFTVTVLDDSAVEDTEQVALVLSNAIGGTLTNVNNPATLKITDDDGPTVGFSATSYSVNEGDGTVTITVNLSAAPGTGVTSTVDYVTSGGTATPGNDYVYASGTLTFTGQQTSKTFTVSIVNDGVVEGVETIRLYLGNPHICTLSASYSLANIVVIDDDTGSGPGGDVDGDGDTDAVDVQLVVNAVLGIDVGSADPDRNDDGVVDAVDLQLVINDVLGAE